MLALRLLELQSAFSRFDENEGILDSLGLLPDRTKQEIAAEYGEALRQFMSTPAS